MCVGKRRVSRDARYDCDQSGKRGGSAIALRTHALLIPALTCFVCAAQTSTGPLNANGTLTLRQAEQVALKNHPRIGSASLSAQAAGDIVKQARSAYFPVAAGNVTSTLANDGTTLSAGALQTSSLSTRFAAGVSLTQLISDFGRTQDLVRSAKLRYQAAEDNLINQRAQILLVVRYAYFGVLGSDSVLRAARATLESRQLTLRQVTKLAESSLRSTLDFTFAQVLVSEAELAVAQAENAAQSSRANLAAAMGYETVDNFTLQDRDLPCTATDPLPSLISQALRDRPDLNLLRARHDADDQFANAEGKLDAPTITVLAAGGVVPEHDHTIPHDNYEALGVNVNVPIFNGGLFSSRKAEARARAQASGKDVQDLSIQISRDVRTAWLDTNTAFRRLDVTNQLVEQARRAVHLAEARYTAGLGSIVELNQAQVTEISAEIDAASAKYEYLGRRSALDFAVGALH